MAQPAARHQTRACIRLASSSQRRHLRKLSLSKLGAQKVLRPKSCNPPQQLEDAVRLRAAGARPGGLRGQCPEEPRLVGRVAQN